MKTRRRVTAAEQKHSAKTLEQGLARFHLPTGPFDYSTHSAAVVEAKGLCEAAWQLRKQHPHDGHLWELHQRAASLFRQSLGMAYPPDFFEAVNRLRSGDTDGLEVAIQFLEADPMFFRTGYVKAWVIRRIKPEMLEANDRRRLQQVVLHVADTRDDRDFRAFCRLARKCDGPEMQTQLKARTAGSDANVRRRVRWVLEALG